MALTGQAIRSRLIPQESWGEARKWWGQRDWSQVDGRLLLEKFNEAHVRPGGYDLSVGDEYVSLWDGEKHTASGTHTITLAPGETVLILTRELVGLPPSLAGQVMPRALLSAKGIVVLPQRIEPTYYGRLLIACLNHGPREFPLAPDAPLCTCVFEECSGDTPDALPLDGRGMGREKLSAQELIALGTVLPGPAGPQAELVAEIQKRHGNPYEGLQKLCEDLKREIAEYRRGELVHDVAEEVKRDTMEKLLGRSTMLIGALIGLVGVAIGVVAGVVIALLSR